MALMTAVFSYNRGQLLLNCVKSVLQFSPPTQIVVFDDGSADPYTLEVLAALQKQGCHVRVNERDPSAIRGSLYPNLNAALELAQARGFDLVHLLQDDMQFVWRSPNLENEVASIFATQPNAAQVHIHFLRRLSRTPTTVREDIYAYLQPALGPIGIVSVARLVERGFRYPSSEPETGRCGQALALEAYSIAYPVIARVPWPMYARFGSVSGSEKVTTKPYLLKPLDHETISRLVHRPLQELPYGDSFYVPWGWRCWNPYLYANSHKSWIKAMILVAIHNRSLAGLVPRRVGDMSDLE